MRKFLSLVLVILMIIIVLALVSCDNEFENQTPVEPNEEQEQQNKELLELIDKLNQAIADLNANLAETQEVVEKQQKLIEALKQSAVDQKDWDEATAVLVEKIAELDKALADLYNSEDEDGNRVYNEADYQFVGGWRNTAYELYDQAVTDIIRATSVAEMDKIIADLLAACKAIKTDIEVLYATVESLEKDGITAEDKVDMRNSIYYFADVETSEYEGATNEARTEAQKALEKRIGEALKAYKVAATDKYVAMVNALPAIDDIKIEDYYRFDSKLEVYVVDKNSNIAVALAQRAHLTDDLGLTFTDKGDPVVKADEILERLIARINELIV